MCFVIRPEDDGANIRCKAEHPSLLPAEIYPHLQDSGTLSILCKYVLFLMPNICCTLIFGTETGASSE